MGGECAQSLGDRCGGRRGRASGAWAESQRTEHRPRSLPGSGRAARALGCRRDARPHRRSRSLRLRGGVRDRVGRPFGRACSLRGRDRQPDRALDARGRARAPAERAGGARAGARGAPRAVAAEGGAFPGVPETLAALHERDDVINSLLTGNIAANAALKVSAFGLDRWLDIEVGAYGSDPHEERYELVAIARERAAASTASRPAPCWWATRRSTCAPRARRAPAPWRWPPASPTSTSCAPPSPTRCSPT